MCVCVPLAVGCIAVAPVSVTTGAMVSVGVVLDVVVPVLPLGVPTMTVRVTDDVFPAASVAL